MAAHPPRRRQVRLREAAGFLRRPRVGRCGRRGRKSLRARFIDPVHYRAQPGVAGAFRQQQSGRIRRVGVHRGGHRSRVVVPLHAPGTAPRGLPHESLQVLARLDWARAGGKRAGQPDYVWRTRREGEWTRVTPGRARRPRGRRRQAAALDRRTRPRATVWWDEISLDEIPAPGPRPVRVASINFRPAKTAGQRGRVPQGDRDQAVPEKTDVILLPEGITVVGTGKKYADVAEPIPGPTTARLGEMARAQAQLPGGGHLRARRARRSTTPPC